jgi:hypothetical protein
MMSHYGGIRLAFFRALQKPTLIRVRILGVQTRIQAIDDVPRETIIDARSIIVTKDDPRLPLSISNKVLSVIAGTGDEEGPF